MQSVDQVMTTSVITVTPETPISEVARILVEHNISGLVVVDPEGHVQGVVSEGDLLVKEAGHWSDEGRSRRRHSKVDAQTAGEAMTSPALTIEPFRAIRAAAEIMIDNHVNRLPVVDAEGTLLGIVSRADLVRAFVHTDAELERIIRTEVLVRDMWLDPDKFTVTVHNGAAKVTGTTNRRSTAAIVERLLAMVPGVDSVETDIAWDVDDGGAESL